MAPVGRPPIDYEWKEEGDWFHVVTGARYTYEAYKAGIRKRQRELEKRRYWDESTGTRERRRTRTLRAAAARASARPRKPRQATLLEQVRSDPPDANDGLMEIDNH